ncbi:unnamed protein product [Phytophthora lilii]|uniref:Unnamed protein product n=1 Tax=Phytophthora lilii TaxID=2077276 RepID=A0A9W6TYL9_9STRA|nr:unnamed protein product [Phytophthora lilii]
MSLSNQQLSQQRHSVREQGFQQRTRDYFILRFVLLAAQQASSLLRDSSEMGRVALLFAVIVAIIFEISSAKILTFGGWPRASTPLVTLTPAAEDNITDAGILRTTTYKSFSSEAGTDNDDEDSMDSDDAESADSTMQTTLSLKISIDSDGFDRDGSTLCIHDDSADSDDNESGDSDDDEIGSGSTASLSGYTSAAFLIGSVANATSSIEATYVNWVSSAQDTSFSSACYREAHIAKTCPLGFEGKHGTCWAQCPYSHPVECGLECIRQNDDCALEVATKVGTLTQTPLSFATMGMFGNFYKLAKGIQRAVKCFKSMLGLTKSLIKYVRYIKVSNPETSQDKILAILYQTENVVIDIPVTISYCIGKKVSDDVKLADRVLTTAELVSRFKRSH